MRVMEDVPGESGETVREQGKRREHSGHEDEVELGLESVKRHIFIY